MIKKLLAAILLTGFVQACTNTTPGLQPSDAVYEDDHVKSLRDKAKSNRVNNPFIWKVTSKAGQSNYLFGTIHVGVPIGKIPWHILTKLRHTQELIVESKPASELEDGQTENAPIQKILKKHDKELLLPSGEALNDLISEEAFTILTSDTRLPPDFLNRLTPYGAKFFYEFMSFAISLTLVPDGNLDQDMIVKAKSNGTKLDYLESKEDVEKYLSAALGFNPEEAKSYTAADANIFLINDAQRERAEMMTEMYSLIIAYKSGDMKSLALQVDKQLDTMPNMRELLINGRNQSWMKKLKPRLNKGNSFVAVGVMHMPGASGLITLLRKDGYLVERL